MKKQTVNSRRPFDRLRDLTRLVNLPNHAAIILLPTDYFLLISLKPNT